MPGDTNGVRDVFVVGGVSVAPRSGTFPAAGGSGATTVTFAYPGSPWTAVTADSWITVTNQSSASGNGTVTHSVAANSGAAARTGTLVVASQTVSITQAGSPLAVAAVSPNGGEKAFVGVPITIRWTATGSPTSFDVELSRNGGTTFAAIVECTGVPGTATSCNRTPTTPATTTAVVRVTARRPAETSTGVSDAVWTIANATPSVTVTSPNTAVS